MKEDWKVFLRHAESGKSSNIRHAEFGKSSGFWQNITAGVQYIYIYSANTSPEDLAQGDPAKTAILPGGVKKASEMSGGGN